MEGCGCRLVTAYMSVYMHTGEDEQPWAKNCPGVHIHPCMHVNTQIFI